MFSNDDVVRMPTEGLIEYSRYLLKKIEKLKKKNSNTKQAEIEFCYIHRRIEKRLKKVNDPLSH